MVKWEMDKILTLDIGASKIRIQAVDRIGHTSKENLVSLIDLDLNNENLTQLLVESIKSFFNKEGEGGIIGISIGAPGIVDEKGVIKSMPNIKNIKELFLADRLEASFGFPIFVLNDAEAGALGELWLGSGKGFKNVVYLALGSGIGSGIIIDHKIKTGSELGHIPLVIGNETRICNCGKLNCAESFLGTKGLAEIYAKVFDIKLTNLSAKDIYAISPKMKEGVFVSDKRWLAIQDQYAEYLIVFLGDIITTYHPEIIILGGGIAYNNESLLGIVKEKMKSNIILGKLENASNLGAAQFAFKGLEK